MKGIIADDHAIFRQGLQALFEKKLPGFEVVADWKIMDLLEPYSFRGYY